MEKELLKAEGKSLIDIARTIPLLGGEINSNRNINYQKINVAMTNQISDCYGDCDSDCETDCDMNCNYDCNDCE